MKAAHSLLFALLTTLIWPSALIASPVSNSSSRYQAWSPPGGETIDHTGNSQKTQQQQMVERLNVLINKAEKAHAADKNFIHDLRDVLNEYTQSLPAGSQLLYEDFTDGTVSKNPAWLGPGASFRLERGRGMYSRTVKSSNTKKSSDKELAEALLGALFKTDKNKSTVGHHGPASSATLYVRTPVSNTFSVKASINIRSSQGHIALGLFHGRPTGESYQLVFMPGNSASVKLQHTSARGTTTIKTTDHLKAPANHTYKLIWTRDNKGNMRVDLDGKTILQTIDTSIRDAFDGFSVTNSGSEFYLRTVELSGAR